MGSLTVDSREPWGLVDIIRDRTGHEVESEQVLTGDIINKELSAAVERKQYEDAVKSTSNGRIFEQAKRMADEFDHGVVIITGQSLHPIAADIHDGYAASTRSVMGASSYINEEYDNVHCTWVPGDDTDDNELGMIQLVEYMETWFNQLE